MKKKFLLIAAVFATGSLFAQDLTSKKGETMLPEEGDYAIGFDASPFLNYVGNFLNSSASSPTANFTNNNLAITGKMFKDAQTAYRGTLRIGFGSDKTVTLTDTSGNPATPVYIEDETKVGFRQITLGGGIEKRRGNTRVQGYYGGEGLITLGGGKTENTYGIPLSDNNPQVGRVLENKMGSTFGFTARGFVGFEVFVFPKISIAGEYGWGLNISTTGRGEETTESWTLASPSATAPSLVTVTTETGNSSSFGVDTDNSGGSLRILFHF